tara:strand:- start:246276 stop:246584 length:309 start_codon:yes stop_codon:yes gene_type:complete
MSNHDYDEQRNFARMSIETRVTYKIKNSDGSSHHGISGDLSATGLYMATDFALKEGDVIDLVMNPSGDRLPPFVAEGTVLRTTIAENEINKFHVSLELTKTF